MATSCDHPSVFSDQYRELHSLLSKTCHDCAGELSTYSSVLGMDDLGRREATVLFFEYHNKGHKWWPDNQGFPIGGEFRIQKNIAWSYYWDAVNDLGNSKIALGAVNGAMFRTAMRIPFLLDKRMFEDLPGFWHPKPHVLRTMDHKTMDHRQKYLSDQLNKTKDTGFDHPEFVEAKRTLYELHHLQSAVQDGMWELATYQDTVFPNAPTTDLDALHKSRQKIGKLWSEIQEFTRKVNEHDAEGDG